MSTTRDIIMFLKRKIQKRGLPRETLLESMITIPSGTCEYEWRFLSSEAQCVSCSLTVCSLPFCLCIHACYSQEKKQHGGGGGKGKWNDLDDGTLETLHTTDIVGETVPDDAL